MASVSAAAAGAAVAAAAAPKKAPAKYTAAKSPKHSSCFDKAAAESPYMFVGALPDCEEIVSVALCNAVVNVDKVTAEEALVGWALPADAFYSLGDVPSAADVSRAAYKHHKGSLKSFKAAIEDETWALWTSMAQKADESGVKALLHRARAAATMRDSRRLVLQDALYFAGLETDEPGLNVNAWAMRDNKGRHEMFIRFVQTGPDQLAAMREAAAKVAADIVADHASTGGVKRKKPSSQEAVDPAASKKVRRAALMTAFIDAGIDVPSIQEMTAEERVFLESGPLKLADVMDEAETIATRRLISA